MIFTTMNEYKFVLESLEYYKREILSSEKLSSGERKEKSTKVYSMIDRVKKYIGEK